MTEAKFLGVSADFEQTANVQVAEIKDPNRSLSEESMLEISAGNFLTLCDFELSDGEIQTAYLPTPAAQILDEETLYKFEFGTVQAYLRDTDRGDGMVLDENSYDVAIPQQESVIG